MPRDLFDSAFLASALRRLVRQLHYGKFNRATIEFVGCGAERNDVTCQQCSACPRVRPGQELPSTEKPQERRLMLKAN